MEDMASSTQSLGNRKGGGKTIQKKLPCPSCQWEEGLVKNCYSGSVCQKQKKEMKASRLGDSREVE